MIYVYNSYNKAIHTYIGKSPFETHFGCFPPSPLDIVHGQEGGVREDLIEDALREKKKCSKD
jgi:hypothetical protein